MTLSDHISELRAELSWNDDPHERAQIGREIRACLLLEIVLIWTAVAAGSASCRGG